MALLYYLQYIHPLTHYVEARNRDILEYHKAARSIAPELSRPMQEEITLSLILHVPYKMKTVRSLPR